jgi:tight adherence protein B
MTLQPILIYALLGFIGLLAIAIAMATFWFLRYHNPDPSPVEERLQRLKLRHSQVEEEYEQKLSVNLKQLLKQSGYANAKLGAILDKINVTHALKDKLRLAGLSVPIDQFLLKFLLFPVLGGLALSVLFKNPVPAIIATVFVGGVMVWLNLKVGKRLNRFNLQLPDALGLITTSLRAGHAFNSAVANVGADMPEPIAQDFSQVAADMNLGIPVKQALEKMAHNLNSLADVRMFVTAVIIQKESGGNLAEVLDKLGVTIRERYKLKRHVAAMTGQSRLTGYVLGCAPITLLVVISVVSYKYVEPLFITDMGHMALGVALVLQVIGFCIMKKIVTIRV